MEWPQGPGHSWGSPTTAGAIVGSRVPATCPGARSGQEPDGPIRRTAEARGPAESAQRRAP
eukprot:3757464-Alexandrium_andersonii.AAC.1